MMASITTAPELVTLKDGRAVSVVALRLLWDLEIRGFDVRLGDGHCYMVLVGPSDRLTDEDKAAIQTHRDALAELVRYTDQVLA